MVAWSSPDAGRLPVIWHPDQYDGGPEARVAATQLDDRVASATQRRRILSDWVEFFSVTPTALARLDLVSRVPQELLDSLAGQPQLTLLQVKWGPYQDVSALSGHEQLESLRLWGATNLRRLAPLTGLPRLAELSVDQAHRLEDLASLASFTHLRDLVFGNGYPGSDKVVSLPDLEWVRPLQELRSLALPCVRILNEDLSPLLELTKLEQLRLPLRREFREQVFRFAESNVAFAAVASDYEARDGWRARPE